MTPPERLTLKQLLAQINGATDMKAATDLGNRIAAEQSMLQNEQMLMNLALAQRQSQTAPAPKTKQDEVLTLEL